MDDSDNLRSGLAKGEKLGERRARHKLTNAKIKAEAGTRLADGGGLFLRPMSDAGSYWVFRFTLKGRRREMGLGRYGDKSDGVSLAMARDKVDEIRSILRRGGDPFKELPGRQDPKSANFGKVVDEYIETMKTKWRGAKTEAGWNRFAKVYAKPLRNYAVEDVGTDDVVRLLKPIWHEKPETASKVRERIKIVLDHARARGSAAATTRRSGKGILTRFCRPSLSCREAITRQCLTRMCLAFS